MSGQTGKVRVPINILTRPEQSPIAHHGSIRATHTRVHRHHTPAMRSDNIYTNNVMSITIRKATCSTNRLIRRIDSFNIDFLMCS